MSDFAALDTLALDSTEEAAPTATAVNCGVGVLAMMGIATVILSATTVVCGVGELTAAGLPATVTSESGLVLLRRTPYLTTDNPDPKSYLIQEIIAGALVDVGTSVTTGFMQSGNIMNGWYVKAQTPSNGLAGDLAAIAKFISGTVADAIELNSPPTGSVPALIQCKLSKFVFGDVLGSAPAQTLTLGATTGLDIAAVAGGGAPFVSGDVGKFLFSGTGRGKIISFTSATVVRMDIIDAFASTSIASGAWSFALIGYILYDINGNAGSHVTVGILPVVGVKNRFVALVSQTPGVNNEAQEWIEWDAA